MTLYPDALRLIHPDAQCISTDDENYSALRRTDGEKIPDKDTLDAAWAAREIDHIWSVDAFFDRFTPQEIIGITAAAATDGEVAYLKEKLLSRRQVRRSSPELQAAMTALVAKGLLTEPRRIEILTP